MLAVSNKYLDMTLRSWELGEKTLVCSPFFTVSSDFANVLLSCSWENVLVFANANSANFRTNYYYKKVQGNEERIGQ